jgi:hypothetical protein
MNFSGLIHFFLYLVGYVGLLVIHCLGRIEFNWPMRFAFPPLAYLLIGTPIICVLEWISSFLDTLCPEPIFRLWPTRKRFALEIVIFSSLFAFYCMFEYFSYYGVYRIINRQLLLLSNNTIYNLIMFIYFIPFVFVALCITIRPPGWCDFVKRLHEIPHTISDKFDEIWMEFVNFWQ